jgi:hypothetical protein
MADLGICEGFGSEVYRRYLLLSVGPQLGMISVGSIFAYPLASQMHIVCDVGNCSDSKATQRKQPDIKCTTIRKRRAILHGCSIEKPQALQRPLSE